MQLTWGDIGAATARSPSNQRARVAARGPSDPEVLSFFKLMNTHRRSLGLPALVWDSRVAAVAKAHSRDMLKRHYFSHTTPDGDSPWDRLAEGGVTYSQAAENIAWGQQTGRAVLRSWLQSPGHRANIERASYTHTGVGKVGDYWTQVFLRPADVSARRRRPSGDRISL